MSKTSDVTCFWKETSLVLADERTHCLFEIKRRHPFGVTWHMNDIDKNESRLMSEFRKCFFFNKLLKAVT